MNKVLIKISIHENVFGCVLDETTQLKWFEAQLRLASKLHLPVLIHERDAHKLTINLLQKYRSQLENIVINCFTGDAQQLRDYVALDCYIVITGIITNTERAPHLKEVIKHIPLQKLVQSKRTESLISQSL
jgi:TatD DNase family protein